MVADIVKADPDRRYVVPSAPGKRYSSDTKVTDMLYQFFELVRSRASAEEIDAHYEKIKERYREIYYSCKLQQDLETELVNIEANLNKKTSVDYIVSRGEYLNARLMAEYLGYKFVDSADWLVFNYNGKVNFEKSYENLAHIVETNAKIVIPGFYGVNPDGSIKTTTDFGKVTESYSPEQIDRLMGRGAYAPTPVTDGGAKYTKEQLLRIADNVQRNGGNPLTAIGLAVNSGQYKDSTDNRVSDMHTIATDRYLKNLKY
jgi:hypothetical protein